MQCISKTKLCNRPMRPLLLTLLLTPLLRTAAISTNSKRFPLIPTLTHPVCRRNFTCSPPSHQDFRTIMADLKKEELSEIERLAGPACDEAEMLGKNEAREEALKASKEEGCPKEAGKEEKKEKEEQPTLPKLSAAEFRVYNSM